MGKKNLVVTIGRQFGSGGREIGKKVAKKLGVEYYNKELLSVAAENSGLCDAFLEEYDEKPTRSFLYSLVMNPQAGLQSMSFHGKTVEDMAYDAQRDALMLVAEKGDCVIVGRSADYVLRRDFNVVSIFISADMEDRIAHVMERDQMTREQAEKKIRRVDKARAAFYNGYSDARWGEAATYDLCLRNSKKHTTDELADLIVDYVKKRRCEE